MAAAKYAEGNKSGVKHNRLFILGGRSATEDDFRQTFSKFGAVTDVWIVKDKKTDESKGVTYVTMSKTSEACLAQEEMNGKIMEGQHKPLKVMIAADRDRGNAKDNEEEKLLRIFIKVSRTTTEDDLDAYYRQYGELDYVSVIRDKSTGNSKGLAYVKYFRSYHAALAVENADPEYKAVFAEKKQKDRFENFQAMDYISGGFKSYGRDMEIREDYSHRSRPGITSMMSDVPHNNEVNLEAMVSTSATQEQIYGLFDLIPGLTYCEFDRNTGIAYIQYSTPQCASYACQKLNGFEYPPGFRISVRFPPNSGSMAQYSNYNYNNMQQTANNYGVSPQPPAGQVGGQANAVSEISQSLQSLASNPGIQGNEVLQTLVNTMSKATSLLQNRSMGGMEVAGEDGVRTNYCNVLLPARQAVMSTETPVAERLFIVSQPSPFPDRIMSDLFCRFGGLIDAHFMPGRNYGYAKYSTKESAQTAISTLHGQEVCGMRLKVMLADPPKFNKDDDASSKRPRNS